MAGLDWAVLFIVLASAVLGAFRGVVKEVFSLGAWVAGVLAAWLFGETVIGVLAGGAGARGPVQVILGFAIAFFAAFLAMSLISYLLRATLNAIGLGPLDRGLGVLFGVARAGLIVVVLGVLAALTKVYGASWWKDAISAPAVETAVLAVKPWLPPSVAHRVRFDVFKGPTAHRWRRASVA